MRKYLNPILSCKNWLLFISIFVFAPAFAEPAIHVSPKPSWVLPCNPYNKKPSLRTIQNGYFFALVEEQIHVENKASYNHVIREIISEAGIQNGSQISIEFEPSFERIDFHEITVWRNGKPLNRLKHSAFKVLANENELLSFIYKGSYSALYVLDDIRKGDRIEYSYTITGANPIFNNKFSRFIYLQGYQTIAHEFISLIYSDKRPLRLKYFNTTTKPVQTDKNGLKVYTWESFMVPGGKDAESQPGWFNNFAYVQATDYSSWNEVAEWALKINPVSTKFKGELQQEVSKLKADAGNDKEKYFRNAVTIVQDEVRYMGIEIGEYSHRANDPSKVFAQRYGDCKDKSLLLVSLLKAGGIDASMALINTVQKDRVQNFLPAHNIFNHAVVVANINGKTIWVDPTISYQRGKGTDIYFPEYKKGLVLKPGTIGLTVIQPSKKGTLKCIETYTITAENRPVELSVTSIYKSNRADYIREQLASTGMAETEKNYLDYYSKLYPKIESADSVTVTDDVENNIITVNEHYRIEDFLKEDSSTHKYSASFFANYINEQLPSISPKTNTPVGVNYPFNIDYNIRIILNGGWSVEEEKKEIKRADYEFASRTETSGDTLNLNYYFAYLSDHVPVNKLDEFRKDIKKLNDKLLAYSFVYTPDGVPVSAEANIWMIVGALLFMLILAVIALKIYTRETPGIILEWGMHFTPIGGWLILIALGLILTPVITVYHLLNEDYFKLSTWNNYAATAYDARYKVTLVYEVLANVLIFSYSIFCLVMLLTRRDILPSYIKGYFIVVVVINLADYIFISGLHNDAISSTALTALIKSIIIGSIWLLYFTRSVRVKETFIIPYPLTNYRYENPETDTAQNESEEATMN
ncbi:DUF3857 domain-containing protein [Mucilaginibacter limnophilus]|uniref:DUF3857 domain-containing protein n=1 Tax=Mucilaginibacter limnophilus TaxID=1932778 RepID=A0A437MK70_9SPHI|nr:DUF3857 domain-containing protein [Mucilaginibacter limnophilus]RVT98041.1 DUF3857 domain-containing protein [Mucilaginibacter limnophilus]